MMKKTFNPPTGLEVVDPHSSYVIDLILHQPSSYWESEAGDAAVKYTDDKGCMVSEIIFLLRDPYGVFVQFFFASGFMRILCSNPDDLQPEDEITIDLCGSPMVIPRGYFVDRQLAAQVIGEFIDLNSGEQPAGQWIET